MGIFGKKKAKQTCEDFESLVAIVNGAKDNEELVNQAENWLPDIDDCTMDYWKDKIYGEDIKKLDIKKLPVVLDVFYKTTDAAKFTLFCMILESTIDELPYLTYLEDEPLVEAKWEDLKPYVSNIIKNTSSALIDSIYLILLRNDPMGEYLSPEEKQNIVEGTNKYLNNIYNDLVNQSEINSDIYRRLEVVLDAACYINNDETKNIIHKISELETDTEVLMFLVKYELVNGIAVNSDDVERIISEPALGFRFFRILDSLDKLNLFEDKITQDDIALARMTDWLMHPMELGKLPNDIQVVSALERENLIYYIVKFTADSDWLKDRGYMLGIVGGYEKGTLSTDDSGIAFSDFEAIEEDYEAQAIKIIDRMMEYGKRRGRN